MSQFVERRRELVDELRRSGIVDEHVLAAIGQVPREAFVQGGLADRAYENVALPIGLGQTISQPFVVALMTQALALTGGERVLEIGTGSGYQAAVLARLASVVVSVERLPELMASARRALANLGYENVELHLVSETLGWPAGAPYDAIVVTAAGPEVPRALVEQLAPGGRLVMPVGTLAHQVLTLVRRSGGDLEQVSLGSVRFVPLIGEGAWSESTLAERASAQADIETQI